MFHFMDSGPTFTRIVSLNARGIVLDHVSLRFWITCSVPEIFAIKYGSCVKSAQILHVFGPKNLLGKDPEFLDLIYKTQPDFDHVARRSAEGAPRSCLLLVRQAPLGVPSAKRRHQAPE